MNEIDQTFNRKCGYRRWLTTFLCFFFLSVFSEVSVASSIAAEVDRQVSSINDPFWLTVSVEGSLDGELVIPESEDFEFSKTGESTNISIINGSFSKERQLTYQVVPLKNGQLTIPSLTAKIDGKDYKTLPIKVEVTGQGADQLTQKTANSRELVFVERDLPKKSFYEGEAIVSTVRLLTRARLTGATPIREAAPDWRLIAVDGQKNLDVVREGVKWSAVEMREGLIPLKAGRLKVPSFGISATWLQPQEKSSRRNMPGSVFDLFQQGMFNMGREVTRKLKSPPTTVEVKALPSGKPQNYADIVGAFRVTSSVSKNAFAVGDTTTVTIEIKGQGALDRMREIKLSPAAAKVYADRPSLKEKIEPGAGLVSTRTLKFAVVPSTSGVLDLGEISFSSFNPFTDQYEELTASLGQVNVSASETGSVNPNTLQDSDDVSSAMKDQNKVDGSSKVDSSTSATPSKDEKSALTPLHIEASQVSKTPWWLTSWVLAIEVLLLVAVLGWFFLKRNFQGTQRYSPEQAELSDVWKDVEPDVADVGSFNRFFNLLRNEFTEAGQDPKSLTSKQILSNANQKDHTPPHVLQALREVCVEHDRMVYGGQYSGESLKDLSQSFKVLVDFFKTRKKQ
jgi:hypothetical protein